MFDIQILAEKVDWIVSPAKLGKITLGRFSERFEIPMDYWCETDYEKQWHDAIEKAVSGKINKASLFTSIYDPKTAFSFCWWPFYVFNDQVLFHNQMLLLEQLDKPFDENSPYDSVSQYKRFTDEGDLVSEWVVLKRELEEYLNRR